MNTENNQPRKPKSTDSEDRNSISSLTREQATASNAIEIPQISLPKGGGALKGVDEKFEVNAANGTASFSIPLPLTPGRNGFSPSLSLGYNSGGGNSPYGLGWSVEYPVIQRKTDKGLPRYKGEPEEDIFMFSGAEDLVPFLEKENGGWEEKEYPDNGADGYFVKRYRPRIEGSFARIEKIYHAGHGVYWKVTTGNNTVTIFGRSADARIADPGNPEHIFQWMPEFSYDDKGNWIRYEYKKEDLVNVPNEVYEKNRRAGIAPFTNTYLKRIAYGNRVAYYADKAKPYDAQPPANDAFFFELVMDYGEHNELNPLPQDNGQWEGRADAFSSYRSGFEIRTSRLCRRILMFHHFNDEKQFVGTPEESAFGENYLVRSLDLTYTPSSINNSGQAEVTYLTSVTQSGYIRKPGGSYSKKSLPPMEFTYEKLNWNKTLKTVSRENIMNAPVGLTNNYQWVDLYGEGISGILTEQGEGWYYKNNLGDVEEDGKVAFTMAEKVIPKPSFTGLSAGVLSIQDLAANGEKQVVVNGEATKGYFELAHDNDWEPFKPFERIANINLQDPNTRLIDLNGDGQPEIVVTEENVFTWYAADGKRGYLPSEQTVKTFDEEQGPAIVFADGEETIFLADMSGDGLTDIVRIRNRDICYWANKGYGKFSAKISMGNAPEFDHPDVFNPRHLHLADVSGTGTTDIIYVGKNKFKAFINLSGNAWSDAHEIEPFFPIDRNSKLSVIDLLGTGTSCIVWSSDLPVYANAPMRYIDLMDSKKPHVLKKYVNNMGKETTLEYKSSTWFYLKDKLEGNPWITKLPFPVQVVSKLILEEKITDVRFTGEYRYHHGYYDHHEREFRGFGMVEQTDSEHYAVWSRNNATHQLEKSEEHYQSPVLTKTWFHTGAFLDRERILTHFKNEYWHEEYNKRFPSSPLSVSEPGLPDARLSKAVKALTGDEYREALRACKGMTLRQEIFALDAPENPTNAELQLQMKPYTVATHNCKVQLLQSRDKNKFGVFLVTKSEAVTINYEREETDYRLVHSLNTKIDELGNVLESAAVVYGRQQAKAEADFQILSDTVTDFSEDVLNDEEAQKIQLRNAFTDNVQAAKEAQTKTHIIYTQNNFAKYHDGITEVNDIDLPHAYRLRVPHETKTYELTGFTPAGDLFKMSELENALSLALQIGYHETPNGTTQSRLIEHVKSKYVDDNLSELGFGFYDTLGLPYENYQLAYTPDLVKDIYQKQDGTELQAVGVEVSSFIETKGKFSNIGGNLWIRSGITHLKESAAEDMAHVRERFFSPVAFEDPFGAVTSVGYDIETFSAGVRNNDGYYLYVRETTDTLDNKAQINIFNYRTMSPARMIDLNANPSSVLLNELGLVKAMAIEGNGDFTDAARTAVNLLQPADSLSGLKEYTEAAETAQIDQLFNAATFNSIHTSQLRQAGNALLQEASVRFVYDFDTYKKIAGLNAQHIANGEPEKAMPLPPVVGVSVTREEHFADNNDSKIQFGFEYSDGMGNIVMTKVQAEPGMAYYMEDGQREEKDTGSELRWIGNGRTVLNNKGKPVKQYEPYFSTNFLYEDAPGLVEIGVTPVLYYDSVGRLIKTEFPDGTLSGVEFDAWKQFNSDQNDTVLESSWYNDRINNLIDAQLLAQGKDPAKEKQAAQKAAAHARTPSSLHSDSLGRPVLFVGHNGSDTGGAVRLYTTFIQLDIEGNTRTVKDARGNTVTAYKYDMLGHRVYQNSRDAGERWILNNLMGNPVHQWDSRDYVHSFTYDSRQRPESVTVAGGDGAAPLNHVYARFIYGESQANAYQHNLRGQVYDHYDTAGRIRNARIDFKGNVLESTRQFYAGYKEIPNWVPSNLNNPAVFDPDLTPYTTRAEYDAMSRRGSATTADNSVTTPVYNEAGLLEQVRVSQTGIAEKLFVKDVDYDAKGRRERIIYGDRNGNNLATTTYTYDDTTFRLIRLRTLKADGNLLQDLYYTYDPVGNISEIEDKALPARFFNNQKIEGRGQYTYDALYRLISAAGREHAGQAIDFGTCDNWKDRAFLKSYSPVDDMAWRQYLQRYAYDPAGNLLETRHTATGGNWTRQNTYQSLNNRLQQSQVGGQTYTYTHHPDHGFLTSLPHLSLMAWNFKDELQAVAAQQMCTGNAPETTWYVYDAGGQRMRKVTERQGETGKKEERLYLGGIEIYKKYTGSDTGLERITLQVMDDTRRIAMVDTRNGVDDGTDQRTVRFQFSNHLGSAALEIDDLGRIINYEEYHPFGTTAYQAVNQDIRAAAKRFRYSGMERDEESGLNYHSARYYLPWLGRWLNPDPIGIKGGINVYRYAYNNPVKLSDPSGLDARLTVNQQTRTITYSTTVHFYGTAQDISTMQPIATRATQFFANNSGTVTINNQQWTVNYDVSFQFHDVATDPMPSGFNSLVNQAFNPTTHSNLQTAPGLITLYQPVWHQTFRTAASQVRGFRSGDNILAIANMGPLGAGQPGATLNLRSVMIPPLTGQPSPAPNQAFMALNAQQATSAERIFRTMVHEIGHTLGFDERYDPNQNAAPHTGFSTDFMSSLNLANPNITMHASHREASARFAIHVANGQNLRNVDITGFNVDSTVGGTVEEFTQGTNVNPSYLTRQRMLASLEWNGFRSRFAPPPPIQLFPAPTAPRSPIQIFPLYNYNPNPQQIVPPISPSQRPAETIDIFRFNF